MQSQLDSTRKARSNCEDICLIAKFLDGSESAFEELFRKYQSRLFSLCRHFLGNNTDAEDAVQDAFLSIYHGLGRFRGDSGFYTWAYAASPSEAASRTCGSIGGLPSRSTLSPSRWTSGIARTSTAS